MVDKNFDKEVMLLQSKLRMEPLSFVPYLEQMLPKFQGKLYVREGHVSIQTNEGAHAVQETIDFLKR